MILSPDELLYVPSDVGGPAQYCWTQERVSRAWMEVRWNTIFALNTGRYKALVMLIGMPGSGKSTWLARPGNYREDYLYVDACFGVRRDRRRFLQIAVDRGIPVIGVWVRTSLETALARNATRDEYRRIPDQAVVTGFERLTEYPPSLNDGFTQIIDVPGE